MMEDSAKYVIVGGGLASVWAAQNIRERDKDGRIVILTQEQRPPYDKPPLSKQYIAKDDVPEDDAYSKFDNWYPDNHVELRLGAKAVKLDTGARTVTLENGDVWRYDKLLLCTGATPRPLDVPGSELRNIFYLRTIDESLAIRDAMKHSRNAVFVGAGFLNMEVASGALERGLNTTLIDPADRPWSRFASPTLGGFLKRYYEGKGARFLLNDTVTAFMGGGSVSAVTTKSGAQVEADMVVVSIGVTLNTELAKSGGLKLGDRGGVIVNEYLQTSDPNVYAAGDIACFHDVALGKDWHAEHHLNAKWQGRVAGANMAGEQKAYNQVPYFFSDFLDLHMILRGDTGVGRRADTKVLGDLDGGEFTELYPDDAGALRMGVAISHEEKKLDPISDRLEELIRAKARVADLSPQDVGMA